MEVVDGAAGGEQQRVLVGRLLDRLYSDGHFPTELDRAEDYGHDLLTGASLGELKFRALELNGRAWLRSAPYLPPHEEPDDEYPLRFTTGRTVYHFHTRTKTARAPQLHRAAPDAWAELSRTDAERMGIREGDLVRVTSRRGEIVVQARVGDVREGTVFAPFHYGYWDEDAAAPGDGVRPRAANELTRTEWDPVSKQPLFKVAAVRVEKVADATGPAPAPTTTASRPADPGAAPPTVGGSEAEVSETLRPIAPPEPAGARG